MKIRDKLFAWLDENGEALAFCCGMLLAVAVAWLLVVNVSAVLG